MHHEFSRADQPQKTFDVILETIWKVNADASYDVLAGERNSEEYIACRTIAGKGTVYFKDRTVLDLPSSSIIFFKHNEIVRYKCNGHLWDFWWFEFSCNMPEPIPLQQTIGIPYSIFEQKIIESSYSNLQTKNANSWKRASAYFGLLVADWACLNPEGATTKNPHQKAIEETIALMHTDLTGLTIDTLAKKACLSVRRFREVFIELTGESPKAFYDNLRLEMALHLIQQQSLSLGIVADKLGYSSPFHLSKAFKKKFGIAPFHYKASEQ